jgi:hypothetical protein
MNMYLTMTVPQALALLRQGVKGLFVGDVSGYQSRADAIDARRRTDSGELALVCLTYDGVVHEKLAHEGKVNGARAVDPSTGRPLWVLAAAAEGDLAGCARLSMEIVAGESRKADTARVIEWGGGPLGNGGC